MRTGASPEFGDAVMACLTVPSEFRRVQNEFPILFRRDLDRGRFSALALFGFENGENLFLDDGHWDAALSSAGAVASSPSSSADRRPATNRRRCMSTSTTRASPGGRRRACVLFDDDGRPTPYLEAGSLDARRARPGLSRDR